MHWAAGSSFDDYAAAICEVEAIQERNIHAYITTASRQVDFFLLLRYHFHDGLLRHVKRLCRVSSLLDSLYQ